MAYRELQETAGFENTIDLSEHTLRFRDIHETHEATHEIEYAIGEGKRGRIGRSDLLAWPARAYAAELLGHCLLAAVFVCCSGVLFGSKTGL